MTLIVTELPLPDELPLVFDPVELFLELPATLRMPANVTPLGRP